MGYLEQQKVSKLCFVATALSSLALAERDGTAVTRSRSGLYREAVQDDGIAKVPDT